MTSNIGNIRVDIKNNYINEHKAYIVFSYNQASRYILRYFEDFIDDQVREVESTIDDVNSQSPDEQDLEILVTMVDYLKDCIADWTMANRLLTKRFADFKVGDIHINIKER